MLRRGELVAVLPGVYTAPDRAAQPDIRMRAVLLRHPDAVLLGSAAARVSYWPDARLGAIAVAVASAPQPQ